MKKLLCVLCMLTMVAMILGGCGGKLSKEDAYEAALDMPFGSSLEEVQDEWGEKGQSLGGIGNVVYRWQGDGGSIDMCFTMDKYELCGVDVSNDVLWKIIKKERLFCEDGFSEKLQKMIKPNTAYVFSYEELEDEIGREGLIKLKSGIPGRERVGYIWLDSQRKGLVAYFDEDKETLVDVDFIY